MKKKPLTLSKWLSTYREILLSRNYSIQTIRNRSASLRHIKAHLGKHTLHKITPHEISTVLKLFTPSTASRILGELRDFFTEAIANGVAKSNPASFLKPPKTLRQRKRLTLVDFKLILEQAESPPWVPLLLLLALSTGQRRADLVKMKFTDVVDGHLRVEQQKKAGKPIGARVAIPLALFLKPIGLCRASGTPGETLLRKANGQPLELSSLSARFHENILRTLGPTAYKEFEWPSLHEVRSLSARTYVEEGMTLLQVQTLLGHKHPEMTSIYLDDRGLTAASWKTVLPE